MTRSYNVSKEKFIYSKMKNKKIEMTLKKKKKKKKKTVVIFFFFQSRLSVTQHLIKTKLPPHLWSQSVFGRLLVQ